MKHKQKSIITSLLFVSVLGLSACGSEDNFSVNDPEEATAQSSLNETLEDDTVNLVIPEGTNLRINYVDSAYALIATPEYIAHQWNGMKSCLEVEVPDSFIRVEKVVQPPANVTDVIQMPDQTFAASIVDGEEDASIQILVDDFNPGVEDRGYFFRQIIGPYMWRFNGYDARTYDPYCAAFVVR